MSATRPLLKDLVTQEVAILASAALVLLSVLRIYYFVSFDTAAALAVMSVANRTQILISTLLTILIILGPLSLVFPPTRRWMLAGNYPNAPFKAQLRTALVWVPFAPLIVSAMSLPILVGLFIGSVIAWTVAWKKKRRGAHAGAGPSPSGSGHTWIVVTFTAIVLANSLYTPWLPREAVIIEKREEPIIGYVIGDQGDKMLVFERSEGVHWVDNEIILNRDICANTAMWWSGSIATLLHGNGVDCAARQNSGEE